MTDEILEEMRKQTAAIERIEGLLIDVISAYMGSITSFRETYHQKRNGRKYRRAGGSHTRAQWDALRRKYNYTCLRCHRVEPDIKLTRDHIDPNGTDDIDNIQPLCEECNVAKGDEVIDYR